MDSFLLDLAQSLGTTTRSIQVLTFAGDLAGVSMDEITAATKKLTLKLSDAAGGTGMQRLEHREHLSPHPVATEAWVVVAGVLPDRHRHPVSPVTAVRCRHHARLAGSHRHHTRPHRAGQTRERQVSTGIHCCSGLGTASGERLSDWWNCFTLSFLVSFKIIFPGGLTPAIFCRRSS